MIRGIGFYGKLPAFGDFIRRNVPVAFVDNWDTWLMRSMESVGWQLKEHWQQLYLNAPVWRFYLSEGVLDESAFLGITMPSVDKVGRLYPFTLVVELEPQDNPLALLHSLDVVMIALEDFMIALLDEKAIDPQLLLEQLTQKIHQGLTGLLMPQVLISPLSDREVGSGLGSEIFSCELSDIGALDQAVFAMACNLIKHQTLRYSLWWSSGSQLRPAQFRIFDNMPPPEAYATFLERENTC